MILVVSTVILTIPMNLWILVNLGILVNLVILLNLDILVNLGILVNLVNVLILLILVNPLILHSCYQRAFRCMEYRPRIPHCNFDLANSLYGNNCFIFIHILRKEDMNKDSAITKAMISRGNYPVN